METKTINQAIVKAMQESSAPMSPKDIFELISSKKYYTFKSKNPVSIISNELRRHTEGNKVSKGKKIQFKSNSLRHYELI